MCFDPSARRYLILPAGPSPSSPLGLQGPFLPHAQQQGPALSPGTCSFEDLGRIKGKSSICPAQLDLDQEAGGFPPAPSLLKTDALPVHHPTAEGGDTLVTTKVQVYSSP